MREEDEENERQRALLELPRGRGRPNLRFDALGPITHANSPNLAAHISDQMGYDDERSCAWVETADHFRLGQGNPEWPFLAGDCLNMLSRGSWSPKTRWDQKAKGRGMRLWGWGWVPFPCGGFLERDPRLRGDGR